MARLTVVAGVLTLAMACAGPEIFLGSNETTSNAGSPLPDATRVSDGKSAWDGRDMLSSDAHRDTAADATTHDAGRGDARSSDAGLRDAVVVDHAPDSPQPGDASGDGGLTSPLDVPGLVLWLDGRRGVTGNATVSAWADQTSYHNDATQSVVALQPVPSFINGVPSLHFSAGTLATAGTMLEIQDAPSLDWGTGDFYVAIVARFDNTFVDGGNDEFATGMLFAKAPLATSVGPLLTANILGELEQTNQVGLGFSLNPSLPDDWIITNTPYNNGTPHLIAMQRVGLLLELRVDCATVAQNESDDGDISAVGANVMIGSFGAGQLARLDGDVGDILAVAGTLTADDWDSLEVLEVNKWGL